MRSQVINRRNFHHQVGGKGALSWAMHNVPAYYLARLNIIFTFNKTRTNENVVESGVGCHIAMGQIRSEASRTDRVFV